MADEVSDIGIVGTGLIGAGWVAFYAAKGFGVALYEGDIIVALEVNGSSLDSREVARA